MRHRELRIDGDGALKMGDRGAKPWANTAFLAALYAFRASSDDVVACSSGRRVLLDGGQRLAQPGPDLNRNPAERIQDLFLPSRLRLLLAQNVSGAAVPGAQPQDILASEACNRAFQNRGAAGSLADLLRDLRSEPRLGRPVHQTQCLLDLLSETSLRNGDCSSCTASPWRSVSSNTGSPVLFSKSARTIVSFAVSFGAR